jgi:hypothetical protein
MPNARYFRDQASLCLEMAQQMSDPRAAENLRASAASHFMKAIELERTAARGSVAQEHRS